MITSNPRPTAFVLAATGHGTMIVNRNDYKMVGPNAGIGVGFNLLNSGWCDRDQSALLVQILQWRRQHFGDGVVAVDAGANIGTVTVGLAAACHGWGGVFAIEAQERVFYALAGNLVLNNLTNARAIWGAVGDADGEIQVPVLDYTAPASFGSLEIAPRAGGTEDIGQPIDYRRTQPVRLFRLDSMGFKRLDLLKIDVEGMEFEALAGAAGTIAEHHPVLFVEHIKIDGQRLARMLEGLGYRVMGVGINILAVHADDPTLGQITIER